MSASAANSAILVQNDLETEDFSVVHFERCFQISSLRALFGHLTIFGVSGTGTENIFRDENGHFYVRLRTGLRFGRERRFYKSTVTDILENFRELRQILGPGFPKILGPENPRISENFGDFWDKNRKIISKF